MTDLAAAPTIAPEVAALAVVAAVLVLMAPVRPARARPNRERPAATPWPVEPVIACEVLVTILRSGAAVPAALSALGEAAGEPELAVAARLLRLGASWEEAVLALPRPWEPVVAPLRAAWVDGVDPSPALRATAAAWRAQRSARAREEAERLAVRLVLPLGLCLLPAFVLLGLVPVALAAGGMLFGAG